MEKDGDSQRKNAHKLAMNAIYETFDRQRTPPAKPIKGKARPNTARPTPLYTDSFDANTTSDIDEYESDDEGLPTYRTTKTSRDSITKRQLKEKAVRDAGRESVEVIRSRIFALHRCSDEACGNVKGPCYILKTRGSHHRILTTELDE